MRIDTEVGSVLDGRYQVLAEEMAGFAKARSQQLSGPNSRAALQALDQELENVTALLDIFLASDAFTIPREIVGLFLDLGRYFSMRGLWHEKLTWGLALLFRVESIGRLNLAAIFNNIGTTYDDLSEHKQALQYYERCLSIIDDIDEHHPLVAQSYSNIGVAYWRMGQVDRALEYARRALDLERQRGDRHAQAMSLMNLAGMHYAQWNLAESLQLAQEALALARETGDVYLQAEFTSMLAPNMVANLMFDEAVPVYEEALRLLAEIEDGIGLARAQYNFGLLCRLLRQPDRVRTLAQRALMTFKRYGLPEAEKARELLAAPRLSDDGKSFIP